MPDDALIEEEPSAYEGDHKPPTQKANEAEGRGWGGRTSAGSARSSIWTRRTEEARQARAETTAQSRPGSDTARVFENSGIDAPDKEVASEVATAAIRDKTVTAAPHDDSHP